MAVEQILQRLDGVEPRGSSRWFAKCPAHEDKRPSLSIRDLPDGRILMHCFVGCDVLDVLEAIGLAMSDLYPEKLAAHLPAQRISAHTHAARDVLKLLSREALLVGICAEDVHRGQALSEIDRGRLWDAIIVIREAARFV